MNLVIKEPYSDGIERCWNLKNILYSAHTPYQSLVIGETAQGVSLFCNGERQSTEFSQEVYHEGQLVPALLLAREARDVLVIGSSEGVVSKMAIAAGAKRVVHVDIDRECVEACARYLPYGYTPEEVVSGLARTGQIELLIEDGYQYVFTAVMRGEKFNVVVLDLPDEQAGVRSELAQQNRLYEAEFLRMISRILTAEGAFITQAGCPTIWRNQSLRACWDRMNDVFKTTIIFDLDEHDWAWTVGANFASQDPVGRMVANLKSLTYSSKHIDELVVKKATIPPLSLRRPSMFHEENTCTGCAAEAKQSLQRAEPNPYLTQPRISPVSVYTEWDPLEEVIVGVIDDMRVPEWGQYLDAVLPEKSKAFFKSNAGKRFPADQVAKAKAEVDRLAEILHAEGVTVRRPNVLDHHRAIVTPHFSTGGAFYSAMPRDCLLAIGTTLIEVPMAWRCRYFETFAYREILQDYFVRGAEWIAAPKPMLREELWDRQWSSRNQRFQSSITNAEPVFDAADFMKLGRDLIGQRSHVTNEMGIAWLQRTLGDAYKIHIFEFDDNGPMHIDTTILPLAPGRVLVNPAWVSRLPDVFRNWEVLTPPPSTLPDDHPLYMTSKWININVLMLDERRVIVEESEAPLIRAFQSWGFETIPCPFKNFQSFGGSFHCATLDVRRRGELRFYL